MKIAGYCSWKETGEKSQFSFRGIELEFCWNDPNYQGDYVVDLEPPFSDLSKPYVAERRIYVTTEPSLFDSYTSRFDPKTIDDYYKALILSWHPRLLKFPQTKPFQPAAKWVPESQPGAIKQFGVSGFVSVKNDPRFDGYTLRHAILSNEYAIKIPSIVYNYRKIWQGQGQLYPVPSKEVAMDYMFHLAIENCRERYYFTEKLIDCLASRVVPLYFGDPSIGSVFKTEGFIILKQDDAIDQINALTEEDYTSRLEAIEKNFELSKPFWGLDGHLARRIIENLAREKN